MIYVIQENLFQLRHEMMLVEALERFGFPVHYYFHERGKKEFRFLESEPEGNNVILLGSVKAAHVAKNYDWNPGSFYNDNHDYAVYSQHYGENMLNWDSRIQKLSDPILEEVFFARPTGDTKLFKGEVFEKGIWDISLEAGLKYNGANPDELIQVCSVKEIMQEARCFVIKGKVITASFYKIGTRVVFEECRDEDILSFAQEMVDQFQVADAFVIDVCRTDKGLKIVEINCFSCSGFYDIDEKKLIEAIEYNFTI